MPKNTHTRQNLRKTLATITTTIIAASTTIAQDRLELGVSAGMSYYLGDLNPTQQFHMPGPAIGALARYSVTDRLAAKLSLSVDKIKGRSHYTSDNYAPYTPSQDAAEQPPITEHQTTVTTEQYHFNRFLIDVNIAAEVNFLSYDHMFRKKNTRFTPYLTAGLGCTSYRRAKDDYNNKNVFILSLPFGFGAKFKANQLLRLGIEWTMHKTFVDDLDYQGHQYGSFDPTDPYGNGAHTLTHNNDWFSVLAATLTFSMWPRSLECHDGR